MICIIQYAIVKFTAVSICSYVATIQGNSYVSGVFVMTELCNYYAIMYDVIMNTKMVHFVNCVIFT